MAFERSQAQILGKWLAEPPDRIIIVAGPRRVGKTYMVKQLLDKQPSDTSYFVAVDDPNAMTLDMDVLSDTITHRLGMAPSAEWLTEVWNKARVKAQELPLKQLSSFVLVIDEIQKIPRWSEVVKGLWDADRRANLRMHVVLLGSSPWLMQKGLTESLLGRYEQIHMTHWSYAEMQAAFDINLDEYIYFGGYPGPVSRMQDESRWKNEIRTAYIEPYIHNDILQMARIHKPALLENLFKLGIAFSGQILAYDKMLGQLHDAGNTTTLAGYQQLLSKAELLAGLMNYAPQEIGRRKSPPKWQVYNTAFISALSDYSFSEAKADRTYWGRLVESAVGAHLVNTISSEDRLFYWREGKDNQSPEVDFILLRKDKLFALEVKSGSKKFARGLHTFRKKYPEAKGVYIGEDGVGIADFLSLAASTWIKEWSQ